MDDVRVPGREACRIERAYLFSHFDSRGGSALVVRARLSRALVAYAATFGFGDDDQLASDLAEEDYVARYAVVVCDRPLTAADDGAELLADYRDDGGGYRWGVVQSRWRDASHRPSRWRDTSCAILWSGGTPTATGQTRLLQEELRVDRRNIGEDAWGLGLLWPVDEG